MIMLDALKYLLTKQDVKMSFRIANLIMGDELRFRFSCIQSELAEIKKTDDFKVVKNKANSIRRILSKLEK